MFIVIATVGHVCSTKDEKRTFLVGLNSDSLQIKTRLRSFKSHLLVFSTTVDFVIVVRILAFLMRCGVPQSIH